MVLASCHTITSSPGGHGCRFLLLPFHHHMCCSRYRQPSKRSHHQNNPRTSIRKMSSGTRSHTGACAHKSSRCMWCTRTRARGIHRCRNIPRKDVVRNQDNSHRSGRTSSLGQQDCHTGSSFNHLRKGPELNVRDKAFASGLGVYPRVRNAWFVFHFSDTIMVSYHAPRFQGSGCGNRCAIQFQEAR